jgi:hypothetical protein
MPPKGKHRTRRRSSKGSTVAAGAAAGSGGGRRSHRNSLDGASASTTGLALTTTSTANITTTDDEGSGGHGSETDGSTDWGAPASLEAGGPLSTSLATIAASIYAPEVPEVPGDAEAGGRAEGPAEGMGEPSPPPPTPPAAGEGEADGTTSPLDSASMYTADTHLGSESEAEAELVAPPSQRRRSPSLRTVGEEAHRVDVEADVLSPAPSHPAQQGPEPEQAEAGGSSEVQEAPNPAADVAPAEPASVEAHPEPMSLDPVVPEMSEEATRAALVLGEVGPLEATADASTPPQMEGEADAGLPSQADAMPIPSPPQPSLEVEDAVSPRSGEDAFLSLPPKCFTEVLPSDQGEGTVLPLQPTAEQAGEALPTDQTEDTASLLQPSEDRSEDVFSTDLAAGAALLLPPAEDTLSTSTVKNASLPAEEQTSETHLTDQAGGPAFLLQPAEEQSGEVPPTDQLGDAASLSQPLEESEVADAAAPIPSEAPTTGPPGEELMEAAARPEASASTPIPAKPDLVYVSPATYASPHPDFDIVQAHVRGDELDELDVGLGDIVSVVGPFQPGAYWTQVICRSWGDTNGQLGFIPTICLEVPQLVAPLAPGAPEEVEEEVVAAGYAFLSSSGSQAAEEPIPLASEYVPPARAEARGRSVSFSLQPAGGEAAQASAASDPASQGWATPSLESIAIPDTVPLGSLWTARYEHRPERPDEMAVAEGEVVIILDCPAGGWWKGVKNFSSKTPQTGWLPAAILDFSAGRDSAR